MSTSEANYLIWAFALFTLHLVVPGPSMLFIFASAGRGELRRALAFVGGTGIATALWAAIAAFGAARLVADAPLVLVALKATIGLALVVLGTRAIVATSRAVWRRDAPPARQAPRSHAGAAMAQGILVTMASVNELVFWSAILTLGAGLGAEPSLVFRGTAVVGVVVIALVFEAGLAWLAAKGAPGGLIHRLQQPLEVALGLAFIATGAILLQTI